GPSLPASRQHKTITARAASRGDVLLRAQARWLAARRTLHSPGCYLDDEQHSVECSFVAVHRIRVTWESSQVRTAFGRQRLPAFGFHVTNTYRRLRNIVSTVKKSHA